MIRHHQNFDYDFFKTIDLTQYRVFGGYPRLHDTKRNRWHKFLQFETSGQSNKTFMNEQLTKAVDFVNQSFNHYIVDFKWHSKFKVAEIITDHLGGVAYSELKPLSLNTQHLVVEHIVQKVQHTYPYVHDDTPTNVLLNNKLQIKWIDHDRVIRRFVDQQVIPINDYKKSYLNQFISCIEDFDYEFFEQVWNKYCRF